MSGFSRKIMVGALLAGAAMPLMVPHGALAQVDAASGAQAQQDGQPPMPSQEQIAQMRRDMDTAVQFRLPADFIPRLTATLQAIRAAGIQPPAADGVSLDETVRRVAAVPGLDAVLSAHGFSAHDFVMGITCFSLTNAVMNNPQAAQSGNAPKLNAANVALIRSNQSQVQALMSEMNSQPG